MKTRAYSILLLILFCAPGFAQKDWKTHTTSGAYYDVKGGFDARPVAFDSHGIIYQLTDTDPKDLDRGHLLFKTDYESKFIKGNLIKLPPELKGAKLEFCGMIGGNFKLIFSYYDKAKDRELLYAQTIDKSSLELTRDRQVLIELNLKQIPKHSFTEYKISLSPDSLKALVWYHAITNDMYDTYPVGFTVFNAKNFNPLWSQNNIAYKQGATSWMRNIKIDNAGQAYLYYVYWNSWKEYKDSKSFRVGTIHHAASKFELRSPLYKTCLLKINGKDDPETFRFLIGSANLYWFDYYPLSSGNVLCSGLFTKPDGTSPVGAFAYLLESKSPGEINVTEKLAFSREFLAKGLTPRELHAFEKLYAKGKDFDHHDYQFKALIRQGDDYVVQMEQVRNYEVTVSSGRYITYYDFYEANDIVLIYLNKEAEIQRVLKVPKRQMACEAKNMIGYSGTLQDGKLMFLFNDVYDENLMPKDYSSSQAVVASIDGDYRLSYDMMNVFGKYQANPEFSNGIWVDPTSCYLNCFYQFGQQKPGSFQIFK